VSEQSIAIELENLQNRRMAGERWFLVNAQTGRERLAGAHLKRQGYRPFIPSIWRSIRHARKIRTVLSAYFPGYLFVPLDLSRERWRPIDGTVGVVRIVKSGARPQPAPAGLVETFLKMTKADGSLDFASAALKCGQSVRLIRGPFAEQCAIVESLESLSGRDRVLVLLSMMNQTVRVDVARQNLAFG